MALLLSNYIPIARGVTPEVESLVREFATRMPKSNQIDPSTITYYELVGFLSRIDGFTEAIRGSGTCYLKAEVHVGLSVEESFVTEITPSIQVKSDDSTSPVGNVKPWAGLSRSVSI